MSRNLQSITVRRLPAVLLLVLASPAALAVDLRICTDRGVIELTLDERNAPRHTANFTRYVEAGFYSGTVLHRVIEGSMVQGGGYNLALERRRPQDPIAGEAFNGLSNRRGTIAASRSDDPDSASAQFFINLRDNTHLDATITEPGYTVFGRVTAGLEVLDEIAALPTQSRGNLTDVPVPLVELESVTTLARTSVFGLSIEPDPATLRAEFNAARAGGNPAETLAAIDALRRSCIALDGAAHLAEAEAAIALGRIDRARYGLEQYLARATTLDSLLPRAQRLYAGLPETRISNNIDELIAHCRRPIAPSIPDGRFAELATMQTIEAAVVRFRQLGEMYLSCVSRVVDGGDLNESEAIDATARHNALVLELTAVATRFNESVRSFKATQQGNFPTDPID